MVWAAAGGTALYCPPIKIMGDNSGAIALAHNPVHHGRTKHIRLAWHYLREVVATGEIELEFVRTEMQWADFLTKALSAVKHKGNSRAVGLKVVGQNTEWDMHGNYI